MRFTVLILLVSLIFRANAQEHSYKQFTTADGLPSNVVYGAFQDDHGYIWFCTNAGVSRYNGISFRNFTVENGLADNEVFGAFQTSSGRIWFRTFGNRLCYYENGNFYNGTSRNWLNAEYSAINNTYIDTNGLAYTYSYVDSFIYVLNEKRRSISKVRASVGDSVVIVTGRGMYTVSKKELETVRIEIKRFNRVNRDHINGIPDITAYIGYMRNYLHALWAEHPNLPLHYLYHLYMTIHPISRFKLHELVYEKDGSYWLTHANKGIIRGTDLSDLNKAPEMYLSKRNVSSMLVDREGNYWFTSPTEGVFFVSAQGVRVVDPGENGTEIYSVTGNADYIAFGKDNEIGFISRKTGKRTNWQYNLLHNSTAYNRVKDLLVDDLGNCWAATDIGPAAISFNGHKTRRVFPRKAVPSEEDLLAGSMKCLARGADNRIYLGSHAWLYTIESGFKTRSLAFKRITAVVEISKDSLLIGSTDGLHQYTNGRLSMLQTLSGMIREHITDLEKYPQNTICAATSGLGLVLLKNNRIFSINAAAPVAANKKLLSDICRKLFIDKDGRIWVCTNKGLSKVTISSWTPFEYEVEQFTTDDALVSNDVNDVFVSDDTVWVATSGGLSYFRQTQVKRRGKLPLIYISSVDTLQNRFFDYGEQISIGLEGLSYESLGKVRYRYRLKGLHNNWQYTDRHQLQYEVLPPGQYVLEVFGVNRFGQESSGPARVVFTIVPPWWKTNWAYALYFLLFLSLLVAGLLLIRRSLKRKERARMKHEQQLHQLELKALRSQMNPHFIFNTLNAVQKYILENDKEASYRYLTRFSKLIRGFLENSRQTTVSLQHELDLLRSYMEMEALRFRNKFTYEIEIDPALDPTSVFIPSMLIQPYVENAIWHGIQHKEANGFVKLSVQDLGDNVLKCRIEDNGIGRKKAGQIEFASGLQHQPVGMTITRQRLELINQRLKHAVSVNFIDLADESPGGSGTIVELVITYLTKKP